TRFMVEISETWQMPPSKPLLIWSSLPSDNPAWPGRAPPASRRGPRMHRNVGTAALLGFALTLLTLAASAALSYRNTRTLPAATGQVERAHRAVEALEGVLSTLKDAETGQRGYLLTQDENYLEP